MILRPLAFLSQWTSLPRHTLATFSGKSRLPIHELDKAKVQKPQAHIRPFPDASGEVSFSAWRFAHAIKKADCARWPFAPAHWTGATGFLLENGHLFNWGKSEFSLHHGMASFYADFARSGLAGRIAQGMALLFLEDKGYAYVGRFEAEWKRRAAIQNKSWPAGMKEAPDFIVENEKKEWVLAESKGGFASQDSFLDIKGPLSKGLGQLDGWDKHITPQPIKSFVIGTFLRESGDSSKETSVITFVDPKPEPPENPVKFPSDAVRRANYASWLSLMGFKDAADRLRTGLGEPQLREVPVLTLDRREYVVSIASVSPSYPDLSSQEFWTGPWSLPFRLLSDGIRVELIGLDITVFQGLAAASGAPISVNLMELRPQESRDVPIESDGGVFYGSIFSDGSLLGELWSSLMPDFKWLKVKL